MGGPFAWVPFNVNLKRGDIQRRKHSTLTLGHRTGNVHLPWPCSLDRRHGNGGRINCVKSRPCSPYTSSNSRSTQQGSKSFGPWAKSCLFPFELWARSEENFLKRIQFQLAWNLCKTEISVDINKIFLGYSHTRSCVLSMAAFTPRRQSWVVATENIWLTEPNVFTICPFLEKLLWPLL